MLNYADERAILNLLYSYAERIDAGDFDGVSKLFGDAPVFMAGPDQSAVPGAQVGAVLRHFVKTYDGIPRTKHLVTNTILEADSLALVRTRSQFTVLQNVPDELPLQVVASGRYHDEFEKNAQGEWAFAQRIMLVDAHGDVSAHLNTGTGIS
jgi:ketosteroid isomerase-like protein